MKSLKDFINIQENVEPVEQENIVTLEILELQDGPLFEGSAKNHHMDPPAVLVMRRKSIRQFPNNQRVAMYYIDKLDKYITVPYETAHWSDKGSVPAMEEVDNVIEFLETIVENRLPKTITFADGKSTKVEPKIAEAILRIHSALSEENKQKISEMAIQSKEDFGKVVDFAYKHLD